MELKEILEVLKALMKKVQGTKLYIRYQVIFLFLKSYEVVDIVDITGVSKSNAYDWINKYKSSGIESLELKGWKGASSKLTFWQRYYLKKTIIEKRPVDLGYPAKFNWTLKIIVDFIEKKFDVKYTKGGMSTLLHDIGLSYTKATYRLAAADEEKQRIFKEETLPEVKKN
jgi:putative transposase